MTASTPATSATQVHEANGPAPRPLLLSFAMLVLMLVLSALDQTIVATALPSIARDLQDASRLPWVFSAYLMAATAAVPLYGKLADLHGVKPALLLAVALFLLGSVACGASQSLGQLILARGLQGAGGGGLLTLAMLSVVRAFAPASRSRLQGLLGASYGLSTMAGPLVGGFLVEHLSWRWAFFINLPVGLLALLVLALNFPQHRAARRGNMDWPGAALLVTALVFLLLSTHQGQSGKGALALVGLGLLALFVWVQKRSTEPLLPLTLFAQRSFAATMALSACTGVTLFSAVVLLPLYFQNARGLSPADSGWHLMPLMAGLTVASIASGRLLAATGRVRRVAVAACALVALALGVLAVLLRDGGVSLAAVSAALFPLGMGIGALFPLITVSAQSSAPMALMGMATASPVMCRSVAGAVGVSLLGGALQQRVASGLAAHQALPLAFGNALASVLVVAAAVSFLAALVGLGMPRQLSRRAE